MLTCQYEILMLPARLPVNVIILAHMSHWVDR